MMTLLPGPNQSGLPASVCSCSYLSTLSRIKRTFFRCNLCCIIEIPSCASLQVFLKEGWSGGVLTHVYLILLLHFEESINNQNHQQSNYTLLQKVLFFLTHPFHGSLSCEHHQIQHPKVP